jgi:hypothetical protein
VLPEGKEQLHILISCTVMDNFRRELAVHKITIRKGLLTFEVENAIKDRTIFLRNRNKQAQSTNLMQTEAFGLVNTRDTIFKFMIDKGYWFEPTRYITDKHLMEALAILKGRAGPADKRTVNSWIRKLKLAGIIEQSGVHQYEFIDIETQSIAITPTTEEKHQQPQREVLSEEQIENVLRGYQTGQNITNEQQHEFKGVKENNISEQI